MSILFINLLTFLQNICYKYVRKKEYNVMPTRTIKGRAVDFDKLRNTNKSDIAIGNASMNAGGDIVGRGGNVVKTSDELDAETERNMEMHREMHASIKENPVHPIPNRVITPQPMHYVDESGLFETPAEAVARLHRENAEEALRAGREGKIHQEEDIFVPVSETISRVSEQEAQKEEDTSQDVPQEKPRTARRRSRRATTVEDDS